MWVENQLCGFCMIAAVSSLQTTLDMRLLQCCISCLFVLDFSHFQSIFKFFVLLPPISSHRHSVPWLSVRERENVDVIIYCTIVRMNRLWQFHKIYNFSSVETKMNCYILRSKGQRSMLQRDQMHFSVKSNRSIICHLRPSTVFYLFNVLCVPCTMIDS